jgi:hypothetical protein
LDMPKRMPMLEMKVVPDGIEELGRRAGGWRGGEPKQ